MITDRVGSARVGSLHRCPDPSYRPDSAGYARSPNSCIGKTLTEPMMVSATTSLPWTFDGASRDYALSILEEAYRIPGTTVLRCGPASTQVDISSPRYLLFINQGCSRIMIQPAGRVRRSSHDHGSGRVGSGRLAT